MGNKRKNSDGLWVPDDDAFDVVEFAHQQLRFENLALGHCSDYRTVLDIGAHVGIWSRDLSGKFQSVVAFEPVEILRECCERNVAGCPNVAVVPCALGAQSGECRLDLINKRNYGTASINPQGAFCAQMRTLDSFAFDNVDLIKIDVEGYELQVLQGAVDTLRSNRPALILEINLFASKHGSSKEMLFDFLEGIEMCFMESLANDYVFGFA